MTFRGLSWQSYAITARILAVPPLNNRKKKKKETAEHLKGLLLDHKSIKRSLSI